MNEQLQPGALYTLLDDRVVKCIYHFPPNKPRLKLMPFPGWFLRAMCGKRPPEIPE